MKAFALEARVAQLEREVRKLRADLAGTSGYLGMKAASAYLDVPLETMKYYHRLGLFPLYRRGRGRGHILFRRDDLDACLERRRAEPEPKLHAVRPA